MAHNINIDLGWNLKSQRKKHSVHKNINESAPYLTEPGVQHPATLMTTQQTGCTSSVEHTSKTNEANYKLATDIHTCLNVWATFSLLGNSLTHARISNNYAWQLNTRTVISIATVTFVYCPHILFPHINLHWNITCKQNTWQGSGYKFVNLVTALPLHK